MNRRFLEHEIESLLGKPVLSKEDSARASVIFGLMDRSDGGNGASSRKRSTNEVRHFLASENRGMVTGSGGPIAGITDSGAFVELGFFGQALAAMRQYDQLLQGATTILTKNGAPYAVPSFFDATTEAVEVSEESPVSLADVAPVGGLVLPKAKKWASKLIRFSYEFAQDSAIDLDRLFAAAFGIRLARGLGKDLVATLISQVATASITVVGDDSASSPDPSNEVGYTDLLALMGAVDPAYQGPSCGWLMNFNTLLFLRNLRDKNNRPLLDIERDQDGNLFLFDTRIYLCPSLANIGAGNKPILFGEVSRFFVRIVENGWQLQQYRERYAEFGENAVQMFARASSGLLVAGGAGSGDAPIVALQNAS